MSRPAHRISERKVAPSHCASVTEHRTGEVEPGDEHRTRARLRLVLTLLLAGLLLAAGCSRSEPARRTEPARDTAGGPAPATTAAPGPEDALEDLRAQARPALEAADTVDRAAFARQVSPPHRQGMFRAGLAWLEHTRSLEPPARALALARLYELTAPDALALPVARALATPLASNDPAGDDPTGSEAASSHSTGHDTAGTPAGDDSDVARAARALLVRTARVSAALPEASAPGPAPQHEGGAASDSGSSPQQAVGSGPSPQQAGGAAGAPGPSPQQTGGEDGAPGPAPQEAVGAADGRVVPRLPCPPGGCAELERRSERRPPIVEPAATATQEQVEDHAAALAQLVRWSEAAPAVSVPDTLRPDGHLALALAAAPMPVLAVPLTWSLERLGAPQRGALQVAAELVVARVDTAAPRDATLRFERLRIAQPWQPAHPDGAEAAHEALAAALCGSNPAPDADAPAPGDTAHRTPAKNPHDDAPQAPEPAATAPPHDEAPQDLAAPAATQPTRDEAQQDPEHPTGAPRDEAPRTLARPLAGAWAWSAPGGRCHVLTLPAGDGAGALFVTVAGIGLDGGGEALAARMARLLASSGVAP